MLLTALEHKNRRDNFWKHIPTDSLHVTEDSEVRWVISVKNSSWRRLKQLLRILIYKGYVTVSMEGNYEYNE
jgi:hypothetical protein